MANLIWKPVTYKEQFHVQLPNGVGYWFLPGIAKDVDVESGHLPLVRTALQKASGTLAPPAAPTITPTGGTGTTSYSYEIVAVNINGDSVPSAAGSTTTGVTFASLGSSVYNLVGWSAVSQATGGYKVLRTAGGTTQGLIGTVPAGTTSLHDTGLAATAYTPAVAAPGIDTVISGPADL